MANLDICPGEEHSLFCDGEYLGQIIVNDFRWHEDAPPQAKQRSANGGVEFCSTGPFIVTLGEVPHPAKRFLTTEHWARVAKFMKGAGQAAPATPQIPDAETRLLRARLIFEEAMETIAALGIGVLFDHHPDVSGYDLRSSDDVSLYAEPIKDPNGNVRNPPEPDLVEIVDGCCDISVVTIGTLIACGVPDAEVLKLVDENNLDKIERGTIREDGKLIKPPDHQPPDIAGYLDSITPKAADPNCLVPPGEDAQPVPVTDAYADAGWEAARMIAGWLEGQSQKQALKQIENLERACRDRELEELNEDCHEPPGN